MADKTGAKKKRAKGGPGTPGLLTRSDPRRERRFEPKTSLGVVLSMLGMSIGAVLVGAGTYGQWLRSEDLGPHKLAPYLLGGGAVLFLAVAVLGARVPKVLRVGDAGVGEESDANQIERIAWCDVVRVLLGKDAIVVQSNGRSVHVPVGAQPLAAARVLEEVKRRIPEQIDGELTLPEPSDTDGEVLALEPPQIAGQRCKASERLIAFEKDALLCARCGEVYHKDEIPKACLTCGAPFGAQA
ncbi:MAG TPA: hypothetical protein VGM56_15630 [Byssovorax sp.]|jgi:hypothetical protein